MKAWTKACWAPLIAASFVAAAHADDLAVVRISDRPAPTPDPGPAPAGAPVANGAVAGAPCDGGAACPPGAGGGCLFNPTRGYYPYSRAPVYRDAVVYYRYWPDKWYGQPGFNLRPMFPQVYMPTDTTQLGFYYARVPQWMPNPNMYPPAPRPEDWHRHVIYAGGGEGGSCNSVAGVAVGTPGPGAGVEVNTPSPAPTVAPPQPQPSASWPTVPAAPSSPPPAAPAPHPMSPSAMNQGSQVQPAAADGEHHWLLDDIRNGISGN